MTGRSKGLFLVMACLVLMTDGATAQTAKQDESSEGALVQHIKKLAAVDTSPLPDKQKLAVRQAANQQVVDEVDDLLRRYPKTSFKDEALAIQLKALADLAHIHTGYLGRLLAQTEQIAKSNPTGRLASENAYYAIQAFVLGARVEQMPEERRVRGTKERYEAFLEDFPRCEHTPVIRASLIRSLIAQGSLDRAREEFAVLQRTNPTHKATRRAEGELYRTAAVGQPFSFGYATPEGKSIQTTDYLGDVLIVHFWATWSPTSMEQIPGLIELHNEFKEQGLRFIGVNVDKDGERHEQALQKYPMPWPQYYDYKGLENDLLVSNGVLQIPTYFVVDRRGVLRSIDPGDKMRPLLTELLSESVPDP